VAASPEEEDSPLPLGSSFGNHPKRKPIQSTYVDEAFAR